MSIQDTVLLYVVPPLGLYVLIALLVVAGRRRPRRPRYRPGRPWPYGPLFWTANPQGAQLPEPDERVASGARGGARGEW